MAPFLDVVGGISSFLTIIREIATDISYFRTVAQAYSTRFNDFDDLEKKFKTSYQSYEFLLPSVEHLLEEGENKKFLESQKRETEAFLLRISDLLTDWKKRKEFQDKQQYSVSVIAKLENEKRNLGELLQELNFCLNRLRSSVAVLTATISDKKLESLKAFIDKQNTTPPSTEIGIKNYVERMKKSRERTDKSAELIVKEDIDDWNDTQQCKRLEEDSDLKYGMQTRLLKLLNIGKHKYDNCLVIFRPWNPDRPGHYDNIKKETMAIAKILSSADDNKAVTLDSSSVLAAKDDDIEFGGLIECVGFVQRDRDARFALLFRLPDVLQHIRPMSLRRALTQEASHSLNDRVRLSIRLAQSLFLIHAAGLVHKDVRPESVIITQHEDVSDQKKMYPYCLGVPYLVAFGQTRSNDGYTEYSSYNNHPNRSLAYISPRHHPQNSDQVSDDIVEGRRLEYRMIDDIYGLGVCLLEIGLWRSLFKATETTYIDDKFFFTSEEENETQHIKGKDMQKNLIKIAKQEIPKSMGNKFAGVVVRCLDCFHPSNFVKYDKKGENSAQQLLAYYASTVLVELRSIEL